MVKQSIAKLGVIMAIKLFCNLCQNFIKDVSLSDMKKLQGDEVCEVCQDQGQKIFKDIEKDAEKI